MDIIKNLNDIILPEVTKFKDVLSLKYPEIEFSVWSSEVGALTDYQGYDLGIDCFLKNATNNEPNNIALSIGLKHLNTTPKICEASVVWGHPSGVVEADLLEGDVLVTLEEILNIKRNLQKLFLRLDLALDRGSPSQ